MQLHIGAQSGASPSGNEEFREFEADLSALFFVSKHQIITLFGTDANHNSSKNVTAETPKATWERKVNFSLSFITTLKTDKTMEQIIMKIATGMV